MDTQAWDKIFKEQGRYFLDPHEDIPEIAELLKSSGAKSILDLGYGTGRHTVYLAGLGFEVYGLDNSSSGLKLTEEWLGSEGLKAKLWKQEMTEALPFEANSLDAVISVQTIHHATLSQIEAIMSEIVRVLKPSGLVFLTMPKVKNQGKNFKEIEPDTFIPLDGPEKDLPHHYFTPETLRYLLSNFKITNLHEDSHQHYCVTAINK